AMAAAALELLGDPERRRAMGEAARLRVIEQFTLRQTIDTFRAIYHELAIGKPDLAARVVLSSPAVSGTGSLTG
ncbi:glycosyl transferase, partial [Streptomyces sp. Lzd4kr]|nr:glycosyl transferase [Streptomyces sp. Lzd4kr]